MGDPWNIVGVPGETGLEVENPSTVGAISVNEPVIIGARSLVQTDDEAWGV